MPGLLETLIAQSRDAIVVKEKQPGQNVPVIVSVNAAFSALTGYEPEEVIGQPYVVFGAVCPDSEVLARLARAIDLGQPFHEAHPCVRKDGSLLTLDIYLMPLNVLDLPEATPPGTVQWVTLLRDVTSPAQADQRANMAEERLRALVGGVNAVIWEAKPGPYHFTYISPQIETLLGYPAERWVQERGFWRSLLHPDDRQHVLTVCRKARTLGQDYETEFRMVAASGSVVWLHESVRVVQDDAGRVALLRGLMVDITARKQMQEAAERDHEFLGVLLNTLEEGIAACDANGTLTFFNGTLHGWHGKPARRITGDRWAEEYHLYRMDGVTPLPQEEVPLWRALQGETVQDVEVIIAPPEGVRRTVRVNGQTLRDSQGRTLGAVTVIQDTTESRRIARLLAETEQHYRSLFDQNVDAVYSFSLDGKFASANPACEVVTGYKVDELLGTSFLPLIVPEDRARTQAIFERAVRGESCTEEVAIRHKDGRRIDLNLTKVPIVIDRQVVGVYGIGKDITVRKTLEREQEGLLTEAIARADCDPLTGLVNHRAFHKRLHEETDRARREGTSLAIAVLDMDNFKFFNDAYGHPVGDDVLRTVASALSGVCRSYDTLARFGGDEFALLMPRVSEDEAEMLRRRLAACLDGMDFRPEGQNVAIPLSLSAGLAIFPQDGADRLETLAIADSRLRIAKSEGTQTEIVSRLRETLHQSEEGFSLLDALVTAVDNKDRYTRRHSEDVMTYSLEIARELGMDEDQQRIIATAALLHDVGKIGVPDAILRKPGPLSVEEMKTIRHHPEMGAIIVSAVPGFEATLNAVRYHHERWDGGGYPAGMTGESIPLMARLMAVTDAYSAMTTDRPYRKGMDSAQALAILESGAGSQWDPECVAAFLRIRNLPS